MELLSGAEYWRVNGYGYPNPFVGTRRALDAWEMLLSFFDETSYSKLKHYWEHHPTTRRSAHAVESWKAAFEEFGLLYVLTGDDTIRVTPAGLQLREAGLSGDAEEYAWIGLTCLLRYPFAGPRKVRGDVFDQSDLLPYWCLFALMRELDDHFWWSELTHVISRVFWVVEASTALNEIRSLRTGGLEMDNVPAPPALDTPAFYNNLNQVVVHAGLNYQLLGNAKTLSPYGLEERRHWILPERTPLIDSGLGASDGPECETSARFIERMPRAPQFDGDEDAYFAYMGARVPPVRSRRTPSLLEHAARYGWDGDSEPQVPIPTAAVDGVPVSILQVGVHYSWERGALYGPLSVLCVLSRGQRLILSHNPTWSYIVTDKNRVDATLIRVDVRPGKPIVDVGPVLPFLESQLD